MYSVKFTTILFICLLVPFLLRLMRYEPYPAILFPSGPQTVKSIQGKIKVEIKQLFAQNKHGQWRLVEPRNFMYPAPAPYLTNLIYKDMGFKKAKPKLFNGKYPVVNYLFRSQNDESTPQDLTELRTWIQERLEKNNYQTSQIKVATYSHTISTINGEILERELKNEKYYALD
ncbi:hypothetical protein LJ707_00895 [Mucilaginibacter sp. UR6-1]|uniref:hypothetical protein n=1 Tax=Mucilaginibacter sp. UR6-1 TaxID=1435643 RepID=UPI001E4883BD|nr:hypothetical protein [Mucilaginibacter sp. UR6-1]MCC8407467.1 hypothetical protein [Mucilaginibacter sp. UR6-1]